MARRQVDSFRVPVGSGTSLSVTFVAPNRGSIAFEFANCQDCLELALNMLTGTSVRGPPGDYCCAWSQEQYSTVRPATACVSDSYCKLTLFKVQGQPHAHDGARPYYGSPTKIASMSPSAGPTNRRLPV